MLFSVYTIRTITTLTLAYYDSPRLRITKSGCLQQQKTWYSSNLLGIIPSFRRMYENWYLILRPSSQRWNYFKSSNRLGCLAVQSSSQELSKILITAEKNKLSTLFSSLGEWHIFGCFGMLEAQDMCCTTNSTKCTIDSIWTLL